MNQERLNAYRIMWIFVFFDLPTETKTDRKNAATFRKRLLGHGFTMMQYSVYIRHCPSLEHSGMQRKRVKLVLPPKGQVSLMTITDKQYSLIENSWKGAKAPLPPAPQQLSVF